MGSNTVHSTNDIWKELATKMLAPKAGVTVRSMITRMNEICPFAEATSIFDNGCGSGVIMSYVLDTYGSKLPKSASLLAGDFSEHMLDNLRKTKNTRVETNDDAWDRLELRNLDAHDLSSIPDNSITHVTGGHLYFLLDDAHKALNETRRVLAGGGVLSMSNGKSAQHLDILCDAVEKIRPGTHLQMIRKPWTSEENVRHELEAAGFEDIETIEIESEVTYKNHRDFAEMLLLMPVIKNVVKGFDNDEMLQLCDQVILNLQIANPAEPGALKGVGIVAHGRKADISA